jgi:Protein of unknown function (DUF2829).
MKKYIGTKIIHAEPMKAEEFKVHPLQVMGDCHDGYYVVYEDGYESWSPKDVFEKAYRVCDEMTFGLATEAVKKGQKITRKSWNGKGMFVVYQKGYPQGILCNKQTAEAWGLNEGDLFICNPYLQIKQVDGSHSMWVPSIGDVLAEDWVIIE